MAQISVIKKSNLEDTLRLDAEYYKPEYLNKLGQLNLQKEKYLLKDIAFVTDGIHSSIDYDGNSEIRCLSAQYVKDNYFDLSANTFISEKQHKSNLRTSLKVGDIILSSVGTIGNCAVVTEDILPANADRHVGIIRLLDKNISSFYISAFLNSEYGRFQTLREATGNVQLNLFIDKINNLIIPKVKQHKEIAELVEKSKKLLLEVNSLYSQAEQMLLEELGFKNFNLKYQLFYTSTLKESLENNRIDAEYYQPKYKQLIRQIKNKTSVKNLGELVSMKKGIETGSAEYLSSGIPFIRVSNLSKFGIEFNNQQYISEGLYEELKNQYQPKEGEILLTKDASIGVALVFKERFKCIISGGILRLKIESEIKDEYLCLVINSPLVQLQIDRDAGGSIINHWRPEQIKNAIIPILPIAKQEKILKLVLESQQAKKKAKELLEEAKQRVEDLIEGKAK